MRRHQFGATVTSIAAQNLELQCGTEVIALLSVLVTCEGIEGERASVRAAADEFKVGDRVLVQIGPNE